MPTDDVDFVVAAWREDGRWVAVPMPPHAADSLDTLAHALRQQPGEGGVLGMVSLGDDTTVLVRTVIGDLRACLSDATAAEDFALAAEVVDLVGGPLSDEVDDDEPAVTGDVTLLDDFGMGGAELAMLCEDPDLYPDDILAAIADRLGFSDQFVRARDESTV